MKNFSQSGEQDVILNYFKDYASGTFLSIGENDGETLSNVRALALTGKFCGSMVECSPRAFKRLEKLYEGQKKGCFYLYDFAIGVKNGSMTFWESDTHLNQGDVGLLSTANPEELKRFPGTKYEEMQVKCFRWKTALNRMKFKVYDFVSIDAEGMCFEILEQMDLKDVKLLCIETNSNKELEAKILEYTSKFSLSNIIYRSAENIIISR